MQNLYARIALSTFTIPLATNSPEIGSCNSPFSSTSPSILFIVSPYFELVFPFIDEIVLGKLAIFFVSGNIAPLFWQFTYAFFTQFFILVISSTIDIYTSLNKDSMFPISSSISSFV